MCNRLPVFLTVVAVCLFSLDVSAQRGGPRPLVFSDPPSVIDKPETVNILSPNSYVRGTGAPVDSVVMHTTEVDLLGTLDIFQRSSSQVSAHFVIAPDGTLYQMVDTRDVAWHATYYNARSIGIEMVGYAHQSSTWNENNLATLEELLAWIVTAYPGIPLMHPTGDAYDTLTDRYDQPGIVAHGQVQPWNRSDPGPYFPWDEMLAGVEQRVDAALPEPTTAGAVGLGLVACVSRRRLGLR